MTSLNLGPLVYETAREFAPRRHLKVVLPCGACSELSFMSWECLADVARKSMTFFGLPVRHPVAKLPSGITPRQDTKLVCFVDGDEIHITDDV